MKCPVCRIKCRKRMVKSWSALNLLPNSAAEFSFLLSFCEAIHEILIYYKEAYFNNLLHHNEAYY